MNVDTALERRNEFGSSTLAQAHLVIDAMDASDTTKEQYRRELRHFIEWLEGRSLYINTLIDWKNSLKARTDLSTGTKAKYLACARTFLRELHRLQIIPLDLTKGVKSFKVSKAHKRQPITEKEMESLYAFLRSPIVDKRAKVLVGLMFYQGCRRVELYRLNVEDFDKATQTLKVLGKGCDDYETVNLHPQMTNILSDYINYFNLKSGPLFPSSHKNSERLSSNALWRIGMATNKKIGISSDKNLHAYRKTFTTKLIQSGMNLLEVQGYTRHRTIAMLQIYYNKLEQQKTLPVYYSAFDPS